MLATRYKSRHNAQQALQRRWWRYALDINDFAVCSVEGTWLWQIVEDRDGSIRRYREKCKALADAMRDEKKGPSRKAHAIANRIFTLNLNKKPKQPTK